MLFSVIIPTHNRADKISKCLESLVVQTFKDFEVIISDDGSTDNTKSVVESYKNKLSLTYLYQEKASGRAARPRNLAAQVAKGEWLCFLDSDDWWYPSKLESMVKLSKDHDVVFHALDTYAQAGKKNFRAQTGRTLKQPVFVDLMTGHNALITSATMIRKTIFNKVGGFHEIDLEDYDLWLRVAQITENFIYYPKILGGYWAGGGNTTLTSEKEIQRLENIFQKYSHLLNSEDKDQAQIALNYIKARIYQKMGKPEIAKGLYKTSLHSKKMNIKMKSLAFYLTLLSA